MIKTVIPTTILIFTLALPTFASQLEPTTNNQPTSVSEEKPTQTPDEIDKDLALAFSRLSSLLKNENLSEARKLMTNPAWDSYASNTFLTALQLSKEDFMGAEVSKKLQSICSKYGLDKIELPKSFSSMEGDFSSEKEMKSLESNILACVEPAKQMEVVAAINSLTKEFMMGNPLEGKIVGHSIDGVNATLKLEMRAPEGMEMQGAAPEEMMAPSFFATFKKSDAGWQWSGYDDEKNEEAMREFEESMGEGGLGIEPFPIIEDFQLSGKSLSGKQVDIKDYKGKVVLVDFWGTWCGPCVAELPGLQKIHEALKDKGFEVLGVAADDEATLKSFESEKRKLPWENIVDGEMKIADKFGVQAFPTTLLIDKNGKHIKSDLFGAKLLDTLIDQMELAPEEFKELRNELKSHDYGEPDTNEEPSKREPSKNPVNQNIGFGPADVDNDDKVSKSELKLYLNDRLQDADLPHNKIFARLDDDKDGFVSKPEFKNRHDVIMHFMGDDYFVAMGGPVPLDPGKDYVPFRDLTQEIDDRKTIGAVYHRYYEMTEGKTKSWTDVELAAVPQSVTKDIVLNELAKETERTSVQNLVQATVVLCGGGRNFFTAGAVIISKDGLALTNYHVAEAIKDSNLVAMGNDGKSHRVIEFLAGNKDRDVALIRLEGNDFQPIPVAKKTPMVGDDLVMLHHSENRFFTYDRGYVMRHPVIGSHPWMEISPDYAPGGSGCGIFNKNHELIGLVSTIQFGDGPSLAEGMEEESQPWSKSDHLQADDVQTENFGPNEEGMLLVKHAVPLEAILSLWSNNN